VVHRIVFGGAAGSAVNCPLLGIGGATWLKFTGQSGGAPNCPVSLQRLRPSSKAMNLSLSGKQKSAAAKNHRTVRLCTGLCGESEPPRPKVACAINGRHVAKPTVGWWHWTVRCAPDSVQCATDPKIQRSASPDKEGDHAPNSYRTSSVAHRTVRCATRQKARIAFQVRLLAVLGL
jgi:hypothetical protein